MADMQATPVRGYCLHGHLPFRSFTLYKNQHVFMHALAPSMYRVVADRYRDQILDTCFGAAI